MARNSNRTVEGDAYADAIARGIPAKKVGYFESQNARPDMRHGEFKTAGPEEELLERPAAFVHIITQGPARIVMNGTTQLVPKKTYGDGVCEYNIKSIAQTPEGRRPGILSLKIEEGALYKCVIESVPAGNVWI